MCLTNSSMVVPVSFIRNEATQTTATTVASSSATATVIRSSSSDHTFPTSAIRSEKGNYSYPQEQGQQKQEGLSSSVLGKKKDAAQNRRFVSPQQQPPRRRPSDLSLGSFMSDTSFTSSTTSSSSGSSDRTIHHHDATTHNKNGTTTITSTPKRRSRRHRRPRHKKRPNHHDSADDFMTHIVTNMNLTKDEESQYVAMDCEMVGVGDDGKQSILARVTIIDWNYQIVLDEYIQPTRPVTDYRTFVSGITAEILQQQATLSMEQCRTKVVQLLQNKIVIGHGLKNDFKALGISSTILPWYSIRDTAKYEPYMKIRFPEDGILWPQRLKVIAQTFLQGRIIQPSHQPHCPIEDARTAMDLYKVSRNKWERVMEYKMKKTQEYHRTNNEQQQQRQAEEVQERKQ